jgi:disulfide bond formation protein DsbB
MIPRAHQPAAALGLAICGLAILAARGSEAWLHLNPCAFCLLERWPYYIGAGLAALALLATRRSGRFLLRVLTVVLLFGAGLSLTHTGVEQHWWPDPLPECSAPNFTGMTMAQRLAAMPARPAKPCEDPDYLIPGVPVSMTQMALAYALGSAMLLTAALGTGRQRRR